MAIHELRAQRATALAEFTAIANKADFKKDLDQTDFDRLEVQIKGLDEQITRQIKAQELAVQTAMPAEGQEDHPRVYAQAKDDPWTDDAAAQRRGLMTSKGLIIGGMAKMIGAAHGSVYEARNVSKDVYGERHPITKALVTGVGSSGGFLVPPEYNADLIELLRAMAVVRSSNPRVMPMPRGTMTLPAQTSAAVATYGAEHTPATQTQPGVGQIVASYKKLKALVPISNDMMRFADPAADAFVRDDLVKVFALREDLAFLVGDGMLDTPRGFLSFANMWAATAGVQGSGSGGVLGNWVSGANSIAAVGGNFITSNETYTQASVANELGGAVNRLDTANVPDMRRMWFMHPRTFNYLNNVLNSLGLYVYRDELSKGTLLGYPFKKSTQIPITIWDATGANQDCSFVFLVEMTDALILDAMSLELAVSREGTYLDSVGTLQSVFANDETLIRAIQEHDFQMRHSQSAAVIQFVRWAPAIS
jgi:HK97 family phage major capsid protein